MKLIGMRRGQSAFWSGLGLLLFFGGVTAYDNYTLHHTPVEYVADNALLKELEGTRFVEPTAGDTVVPGDWPQWRGARRDGVSQETGLLRDWPAEGLRVLWRLPCGKGYSAPVVANGRLYLHFREDDREIVVCREAATGTEIWRYAYDAPCSLPYGNGPRSTPTVDGERVYTVGATGLLHCLRALTGKVVWSKNLLEEFDAKNLMYGVCFSPLVEGDLLLTNPGGTKGNAIVALNKHTGATVWTALDDPASYSSPLAVTAAGVRQLLFLTGEALVSLSPADGKLLWRFPWPTHEHVNVATPIAVDDYVFISAGYQMGCALVKVMRDAEKLRVEPVYQTRAMTNHFSSSVLYREHIFGFTEAGLLTCMQFRTGKVLWRQRGFGKGTLLAADGQLIVLREAGGKLARFEPNPESYRETGTCRVPDQVCWTMPVLAQGRLYVRTEEELLCFDLAADASAK